MSAEALPQAAATVLIAPDAPADLVALAAALQAHGIVVRRSANPQAALRTARRAPPDLIVLDAAQPGSVELCRQLRQEPRLRHTPVILVTDGGSRQAPLFAAGACDCVARPLDTDEALARIRAQLQVRAALRRETALREQIEDQLQRAYEMLEHRIALRTDELLHLNESLAARAEESARAEASLRQSESRMRRLVESNIIGLFFWNAERRLTGGNDAFLKLLGYTRAELESGKIRLDDVSPPEYAVAIEHIADELRRTGSFQPYEKEYVRKDGSRVPVLVGGALLDAAHEDGVAFVLDLSARKQAEARIRHIAHHDALTGLPNRTLLEDRLQQALAHAHRTGSQLALLFIDLDYFKHINDSLGHQIGDCVLRMVAQRLCDCVRADDTVARLGGDEFVLVLPLECEGADAALVARKALDSLDQPFYCAGHELHVDASIGISLYPQDGADVEALMRTADTAMHHAKDSQRGSFRFFTQDLNAAAQRRHTLSGALRQALALDELTLHYQPQVDLETGAIRSAEALLRWQRHGAAPVSCTELIAIAEETGLILPIGEWVLREACRQLGQWHALGYTHLAVAVNLSPRQFAQPDLHQAIRSIIRETGVPGACLDLEITEGTLMQRTEESVVALQRIADMGIKLSIDDFGTGYSSLAYLKRFPVDTLKIDQSFVRGIGRDANDAALVAAIISMAHSLQLNVLAEGVETPEQRQFLCTHGCASGQGFYFSKAVPADAFTDLLRRQRMPGANA